MPIVECFFGFLKHHPNKNSSEGLLESQKTSCALAFSNWRLGFARIFMKGCIPLILRNSHIPKAATKILRHHRWSRRLWLLRRCAETARLAGL